MLNLLWLALSVTLVTVCLRSLSSGRRFGWTVVVALALLVLLLFPAISMTDDRVAMQTFAEFEHTVFRMETLPPAPLPLGLLFATVALCLALCVLAATLFRVFARVWHLAAQTLRMRYVQARGIRGPSLCSAI